MDSQTVDNFLWNLSNHCSNHSRELLNFLLNLSIQSERQNKASKPMVWIGVYIAIASLCCILPMLADLLHGLKNKKLWFPCKYFTLNAASLTVIAVAMKLPVDLNNEMPNPVDQVVKLGSMAFMCTMMANLLPSLATMDSKELLTNIIALGILVITLAVNVCIQIVTGVVYNYEDGLYEIFTDNYWMIAYIYVAMLLMLLMMHICSAITILKSKQILESKYKLRHETTLKDLELQQSGRVTVEKLKQHVSNHWIMAGTGSPQFMTVCSATTSASGVICVSSTILHVITMSNTRQYLKYYGSDYKWSVLVILITQFIGVILGTVTPLCRCFASLSFQVSLKWVWNHARVFKVESYCTQKLSDWKQSSVLFKHSSRRCKIVIQGLKVLILNYCIGIHMMIVVACKMTTLIPIFCVICVFCCCHCWNMIKVMFGASHNMLAERPTELQQNKDLSQYVLQLQDIEFAERTLKNISKSMNRMIQRAEKQQSNNLMKLLEKSSNFKGVGKYDVSQVPPLTEEKYMDCWSLPVVTLTAIAISLPKIQNNKVDMLLRSVSEGLTYAKYVEKPLNASEEYAIIQKAARTLWLEVEIYQTWLGNKLQLPDRRSSTTREIVQLFSDTARNIVTEVESKNKKDSDDSSLHKLVSANSMYRISQTVLVSHNADIDQVSQEEMFVQLSSMISDILAACLTNLPQVITMKCHTVIDKREASVHIAAQLLGETMQIIRSLQERELPSLRPDELPLIDKWRDCLQQPSP